MCIKKPTGASDGRLDAPAPEVGDEDIVTKEVTRRGKPFYFLERFGDGFSYSAKCFSPLSDLDETTLVTEEFEEKYCVPVNKKL
jgi:hypothetical protein